MNVDYRRKLYALLQNPQQPGEGEKICNQLDCLKADLADIQKWWRNHASKYAVAIANTSDRVNLKSNATETDIPEIEIRHPISGQSQTLSVEKHLDTLSLIPEEIRTYSEAKTVYHWFWRFYPELKANQQQDLLLPANEILPDCPWHSYQTTVSALVGAMYPESWQPEDEIKTDSEKRPHLFLFTFSPVQEFIKASRKFIDFWAGSYLLHYLGAKLCWKIASIYGADAVITPSLWQQEIIDALIVQKYPDFASYFACLSEDGLEPIARFEAKKSASLATAGFPNVITALVPGKDEAKELGKELSNCLKQEWKDIALNVRNEIKKTVIEAIERDEDLDALWSKIGSELPSELYQDELLKLRTGTCWTWNSLWDAQINNTWETYWTALPLGDPEKELITFDRGNEFEDWERAQNHLSNARNTSDKFKIATDAEKQIYDSFNVGTWWGSFQARLGQLIQSVKNTRSWQIPTAPGERSSLSGQYTALHPQHLYRDSFREGGGLPAGSMRLFWRVMAEVYPGLFNGSEMLNAIELTKRMAWQHGGVAESLGINIYKEQEENTDSNFDEQIDPNDPEDIEDETPEINYEQLIRFPNLSSIAASRVIYELVSKDKLSKLDSYWHNLRNTINSQTIKQDKEDNQPTRKLFKSRQRKKYRSKTQRKSQVPKIDEVLGEKGKLYNGVMFSSKWLADDMGLHQTQKSTDEKQDRNNQITVLRTLVDQAHQKSGFTNGSPADWWVIVLGDGDGMGKYVSGAKLGHYEKYIVDKKVDKTNIKQENYESLRQETRKRMGPATHVALNRALLDFSNRLVPYITERRFCGKVVYSGGDDVMAVLPLADLPEYLLSIRAAWSGKKDPGQQEEFTVNQTRNEDDESSGYWHPKNELRGQDKLQGIPQRPLFTMGQDATMSLGIVIAYKTVPLPTVLETLWTAEKERAKKMPGAERYEEADAIPVKDGLCFRVIYGSGNVLEALMKGHLLKAWWDFIKEVRPKKENNEEEAQEKKKINLSPLLYRLAEELPKHTAITEKNELIAKAATVIIKRREQNFDETLEKKLICWLNLWEKWAYRANPNNEKDILGTKIEDLSKLLRFTAFWLDKMSQFDEWVKGGGE